MEYNKSEEVFDTWNIDIADDLSKFLAPLITKGNNQLF